MPKITINVDAIATGTLSWHATEAIRQSLVSNGIIIVSDTHPNLTTSGIRQIIFKHPDLPVSFQLEASNSVNIVNTTIRVLSALGTFQIFASDNNLKPIFRESPSDLPIRLSIHVAYNEHATFFGFKSYNNLNGLTEYVLGLVKFKWSSVPEHGYYAGKLSGNTPFYNSSSAWRYIHVNGAEAIPALSTNGALNSFFATSTDVILPGKIMLLPWYVSFLGISTKTTDAELEGVNIATGFPEDCPNEFTLNGEEYVRADKLVMKV